MNKIYDNDFKKFFKYAKEIKELPPIPKNFNTKHLQDFINEFESVQQENERLKDKINMAIKYYESNQQECVIGRNKDEKLIKEYYLPAQCSKKILDILKKTSK